MQRKLYIVRTRGLIMPVDTLNTYWCCWECRCDKILMRVYNSEKKRILQHKLFVEEQTSTVPGCGAGQQRLPGWWSPGSWNTDKISKLFTWSPPPGSQLVRGAYLFDFLYPLCPGGPLVPPLAISCSATLLLTLLLTTPPYSLQTSHKTVAV